MKNNRQGGTDKPAFNWSALNRDLSKILVNNSWLNGYTKANALKDINEITQSLGIALDHQERWRYSKKENTLWTISTDEAKLKQLSNTLIMHGEKEGLNCQFGAIKSKNGFYGIHIAQPFSGQMVCVLRNIEMEMDGKNADDVVSNSTAHNI